MTRSRIAIVAMSLLLATSCTTVPGNNSDSASASERARIERKLHEIFIAAQTKDFERLESFHVYGPNFTKFTGSSPERLDGAASRLGERNGLAAINRLKMSADGLKVDLFGEIAIATFVLNYSFDSATGAVQRKDRTTLVFVKERGEWKITHEHLSPITN